MFLLSTPRGIANDFYYYYMLGKSKPNWKSYRYSSLANPLNTTAFVQQMKESLDDLTFRQEILAEFLSTSNTTVFFSFNNSKHVQNIDKYREFIPKARVIAGIDIGFRDSSAHILIALLDSKYIVFSATMVSQASTKDIHEAFKAAEDKYGVTPEVRLIDPSAALTAADFAQLHDYLTYPAENSVKEGISLLNQLFREDSLIISDELTELIEQVALIEWSDKNVRSGDMFKKHKSHHFDLIHALRYALYTFHKYNVSSEIVVI